MEFQSHCLKFYLLLKEQSMPYCPRALEKLFFDLKNEALKVLKRIFGYFLGASKKLPAQQSGTKLAN
jgi:hypothetical protein